MLFEIISFIVSIVQEHLKRIKIFLFLFRCPRDDFGAFYYPVLLKPAGAQGSLFAKAQITE